MSTISASTTSTTAYKVTADTTGALVLQTGATPTTAVTIGTDQNTVFNSTGAVTVSSGTTAQRPASPTVGMMRYNTTESKYEVYTGTVWQSITTAGYPYSVFFFSNSWRCGWRWEWRRWRRRRWLPNICWYFWWWW
jgi:hypothetical protein